MRYIKKRKGQPKCISDFVHAQISARKVNPEGVFPVDYSSFPSRALREQLIREQRGLCAYTGSGIDDARLAERQPRHGNPPGTDYWFIPHIEHLKPQSQCRTELEQQGKVPGIDLGEDMDYHNMIAALKVDGSGHEQFGAIDDRKDLLPVKPTDVDCEARFRFDGIGHIHGVDADAATAINMLKLDHTTLENWRRGAIDAWIPEPAGLSSKELLRLSKLLDKPLKGRLVEFCFVIKSYVLSLLP